MSFIHHRRATSPNKFECRNYDSKTQHFDTSAVEAVIKLVMRVLAEVEEATLEEGMVALNWFFLLGISLQKSEEIHHSIRSINTPINPSSNPSSHPP